jgi:hypothetical protein
MKLCLRTALTVTFGVQESSIVNRTPEYVTIYSIELYGNMTYHCIEFMGRSWPISRINTVGICLYVLKNSRKYF